MKNIFTHALCVVSTLCFLFAGRLFYASFSEESPGMLMVYLLPVLVIGLLLGTLSFLLVRSRAEPLTGFWGGLHKVNLALMALGVIGVVFAFNN